MICDTSSLVDESVIVLRSSLDSIIKVRHGLDDGLEVEACIVDLPYRSPRKVICISSQVGCSFTCNFCASGHSKFYRNLSSDEIVEQVDFALDTGLIQANEQFDVTYTGTGEPLANMGELRSSAIQLIEELSCLDHINISTIGPVNGINKLASWAIKNRFHIQYSLHSPFDEERVQLLRQRLPSIRETIHSLNEFAYLTGDTPCLNYILFDGINDSQAHARSLVKIVTMGSFYVKISRFCEIGSSDLNPSSQTKRNEFVRILRAAGVKTKLFVSQGQDIRAGCGQLLAEVG